MHFPFSLPFLVDDIWLLPVPGCVSLRVHSVAPQSDSGPFTTPHVAMLWPQVKFTHRCQVCKI